MNNIEEILNGGDIAVSLVALSESGQVGSGIQNELLSGSAGSSSFLGDLQLEQVVAALGHADVVSAGLGDVQSGDVQRVLYGFVGSFNDDVARIVVQSKVSAVAAGYPPDLGSTLILGGELDGVDHILGRIGLAAEVQALRSGVSIFKGLVGAVYLVLCGVDNIEIIMHGGDIAVSLVALGKSGQVGSGIQDGHLGLGSDRCMLGNLHLEQIVAAGGQAQIVSAGLGKLNSGDVQRVLYGFVGSFGNKIAVRIIDGKVSAVAAGYPPEFNGSRILSLEHDGVDHAGSRIGLAAKVQALRSGVSIVKGLVGAVYLVLCGVDNVEIILNGGNIAVSLVALGKGSQIQGSIQHEGSILGGNIGLVGFFLYGLVVNLLGGNFDGHILACEGIPFAKPGLNADELAVGQLGSCEYLGPGYTVGRVVNILGVLIGAILAAQSRLAAQAAVPAVSADEGSAGAVPMLAGSIDDGAVEYGFAGVSSPGAAKVAGLGGILGSGIYAGGSRSDVAVVHQQAVLAGIGLRSGNVALVVAVFAGVEHQVTLGKHSGHAAEDVVASAVNGAIVEGNGRALAAVQSILTADELTVVEYDLLAVVADGKSRGSFYILLILHSSAALGQVCSGGRAFLGAAIVHNDILRSLLGDVLVEGILEDNAFSLEAAGQNRNGSVPVAAAGSAGAGVGGGGVAVLLVHSQNFSIPLAVFVHGVVIVAMAVVVGNTHSVSSNAHALVGQRKAGAGAGVLQGNIGNIDNQLLFIIAGLDLDGNALAAGAVHSANCIQSIGNGGVVAAGSANGQGVLIGNGGDDLDLLNVRSKGVAGSNGYSAGSAGVAVGQVDITRVGVIGVVGAIGEGNFPVVANAYLNLAGAGYGNGNRAILNAHAVLGAVALAANDLSAVVGGLAGVVFRTEVPLGNVAVEGNGLGNISGRYLQVGGQLLHIDAGIGNLNGVGTVTQSDGIGAGKGIYIAFLVQVGEGEGCAGQVSQSAALGSDGDLVGGLCGKYDIGSSVSIVGNGCGAGQLKVVNAFGHYAIGNALFQLNGVSGAGNGQLRNINGIGLEAQGQLSQSSLVQAGDVAGYGNQIHSDHGYIQSSGGSAGSNGQLLAVGDHIAIGVLQGHSVGITLTQAGGVSTAGNGSFGNGAGLVAGKYQAVAGKLSRSGDIAGYGNFLGMLAGHPGDLQLVVGAVELVNTFACSVEGKHMAVLVAAVVNGSFGLGAVGAFKYEGGRAGITGACHKGQDVASLGLDLNLNAGIAAGVGVQEAVVGNAVVIGQILAAGVSGKAFDGFFHSQAVIGLAAANESKVAAVDGPVAHGVAAVNNAGRADRAVDIEIVVGLLDGDQVVILFGIEGFKAKVPNVDLVGFGVIGSIGLGSSQSNLQLEQVVAALGQAQIVGASLGQLEGIDVQSILNRIRSGGSLGNCACSIVDGHGTAVAAGYPPNLHSSGSAGSELDGIEHAVGIGLTAEAQPLGSGIAVGELLAGAVYLILGRIVYGKELVEHLGVAVSLSALGHFCHVGSYIQNISAGGRHDGLFRAGGFGSSRRLGSGGGSLGSSSRGLSSSSGSGGSGNGVAGAVYYGDLVQAGIALGFGAGGLVGAGAQALVGKHGVAGAGNTGNAFLVGQLIAGAIQQSHSGGIAAAGGAEYNGNISSAGKGKADGAAVLLCQLDTVNSIALHALGNRAYYGKEAVGISSAGSDGFFVCAQGDLGVRIKHISAGAGRAGIVRLFFNAVVHNNFHPGDGSIGISTCDIVSAGRDGIGIGAVNSTAGNSGSVHQHGQEAAICLINGQNSIIGFLNPSGLQGSCRAFGYGESDGVAAGASVGTKVDLAIGDAGAGAPKQVEETVSAGFHSAVGLCACAKACQSRSVQSVGLGYSVDLHGAERHHDQNHDKRHDCSKHSA